MAVLCSAKYTHIFSSLTLKTLKIPITNGGKKKNSMKNKTKKKMKKQKNQHTNHFMMYNETVIDNICGIRNTNDFTVQRIRKSERIEKPKYWLFSVYFSFFSLSSPFRWMDGWWWRWYECEWRIYYSKLYSTAFTIFMWENG